MIEPSDQSQSQAQDDHRTRARRSSSNSRRRRQPRSRPAKPGAAEAYVTRISDAFLARADALASVLRQRVRGRRVHAGRRLSQLVSSYNTRRPPRQHHARATSASKPSSWRPAVRSPRRAVGDRRLARGDAGRLLRHRHDEHAQDDRSQLQLPAAVRSARRWTSGRRASCSSCAAGSSSRKWKQDPGGGDEPSVEEVYTPATLPGLGAQPHLPARAGRRSASTGARRRRLRAQRRRPTASPSTTFTDHDSHSASTRSTTKRSSTFRSCAMRGCSRCTRMRRRPTSRRPADAVLHAAGARRRFDAARLRELAFPRSQQPAAAGRMARPRQPVPRHGGVLRRRQGRGAARRSRPERAEERLRSRLPHPRPGGHAAAHRVREGQRRASHGVCASQAF